MSASSDLEHLLFHQPEERGRFHRALLDFAEYHVFTSSEPHGHAVLRNDAGVAHAMVFTSPEAAAAFPRPSGSEVRIMDGRALFTSLSKSGIPWWVFNVGGPAGPIAFPVAMCSLILAAAPAVGTPAAGAPVTGPLPFARGVLTQHARGHVSVDGVMRALMSFDDWLVPVALMARGPEPRVADALVVFSQEQQLPAGEAWLFTDREAADRVAAKWPTLGTYQAGVAALDWARQLAGSGLTIVKVNPGGPREEYWGITSGAFALTLEWAERCRAESSSAPQR